MESRATVRRAGALFCILLMYFFAPEFGAISPTLALMPDHYGITPSQSAWISALANPSACVAGLLVGGLAGRRASFRTCALLATAFYALFGGLPFLWPTLSFPMLLVSRALFGLGCGCLAPLSQAIITRMFETETARSAWIGVVNIVFSIGASVGSIITGALAAGGVWQNAYAFYLLAIVPFIAVVLFLHDRDLMSAAALGDPARESASTGEKRRLPAVAVAFIVVFALSTVLTQTFFNYAGIAMVGNGQDTLVVGTVYTAFTVAGIAIAAANAVFWKVFRLWNFPLAFLLITLGYVFCWTGAQSGGVALFFAAAAAMGVGCCLAGMVMPMVMSVTCSAASLTLAIGLQEVARNLGSFLSAPWLNIVAAAVGDTPLIQFSAAAILGIAATAIASALAFRNNRRFKDSKRGSEG